MNQINFTGSEHKKATKLWHWPPVKADFVELGETELCAAKFQPYAKVEIDPICLLQAPTLWLIHEPSPSKPTTP